MAKPVEVVEKKLDKCADQIEKFREKINSPGATPEQIEEWEETIDNIQAQIDKLTGGGPTPTPTR